MSEVTLTRRGFMVGCSAAVAAMAGARVNYVALGNPADEPGQEILIVVSLRGGCDGLSLVPPVSGADRGHYEAARPQLQIPTSGGSAALPIGLLSNAVELGLHPAAAPLVELFQAGHLAVVHAAGLTSDTRSHFDAMEYMERGTPGSKSTPSGWLARHLQSAEALPPDLAIPALAAGTLPPTSLEASAGAVAMNHPNDFSFYGHWRWADTQRAAIRRMYDRQGWLHEAATRTLDAVDLFDAADPGNYSPANGALYPGGSFGDQLQLIAQLVKLQLGIRVATVELGSWDTHEYQGTSGAGYFGDMVGQLAQGMHAFYTDMDGAGSQNYASRITMVVMSEFGRRLRENNSQGTDHGHGNVMFVLGGGVNGGLFGSWPGLEAASLYDGQDLAITTDYRQVLSEILIRRMANNQLGTVFPGYANYNPLGVVQGTDLDPIYGPPPGTLQPALYLPGMMR